MKNRILKSFFSCFMVGLLICSNTFITYAAEIEQTPTTGDEIDQDQDLVGENDNAVDDDTGGGKPSSGGGGAFFKLRNLIIYLNNIIFDIVFYV